MSRAGFVLVGGTSSRMGQDKALLVCQGATMAERTARIVREAAGAAALVGPPQRYAHLGLPVIADLRPGCGPLGGILTALASTAADWNLIVACDLPALSADVLKTLIAAAEASDADCLAPQSSPGYLEPLCAVYHRRARDEIESALQAGVRKVHDALARLRVRAWDASGAAWLENRNSPEDWPEQNG